MKKHHYKTINENTMQERSMILEYIEGNKYKLYVNEYSYQGAGLPVSRDIIIIDDIETYIKENGYKPCSWSMDI